MFKENVGFDLEIIRKRYNIWIYDRSIKTDYREWASSNNKWRFKLIKKSTFQRNDQII